MSLEVERKFALEDGQQLPAIAGLGEPEEFDLEATYFDTVHFALTRAHQVVRRRAGGSDQGWHLKLPGTDAEHRVEQHAPLEARRLPAGLRAVVADALDGHALVPVATLRTRRHQAALVRDDIVLALVCVDDVVAEAAGERQSWREAEVELVAGGEPVLDELTEAFAAAGIHPSPSHSKIGRALDAALAADEEASRHPAAAVVVLDYLSRQVGTLQELAEAVLADVPDAVHRSRVATRRLRTALRTFKPLFDAGSVDRLRDELAWHAGELGGARDAEVLRDGLLAALDNLDVPAAARERRLVGDALQRAHAEAHAELAATMATPRYDALQQELAQWLAAPPVRTVGGSAAALLHGLLDRARGRVARQYTAALQDPDDLASWHEVRKSAKAVRYGSEALVPLFGDRAAGHAAAWEAVTDAFGELQDSVVARSTIAGLDADTPVLAALAAYQVGRGQAELVRGRAALETALAESL